MLGLINKIKSPLVEPPVSKGNFFKIAVKPLKTKEAIFMQKFIEKCGPKDIVAILVIIGAFFLKFKGIDGIASMILVGICAAYFGAIHFVQTKTDVQSNNQPK